MAKKKQTPDVGVSKLADDTLASEYIGIQTELKEKDAEKKIYYGEIYARVENKGKKAGKDLKSKLIETSGHTMKLEARTKVIVDNDVALKVFDNKKIDDYDLDSSIELKEGVDAKKIPKTLLKEMNKFFCITTRRIVRSDVLAYYRDEGKITEQEYKSCISAKTTFALKVAKTK